MNILLISYYFPPFNTIGAIRAGKMAKYFHQMGHDVRVIAADHPYLAGELPKTLAVEIPSEKISYTEWFDLNKWTRAIYQKVFRKKNLSLTVHHEQVMKKQGAAQFITQAMRSLTNIPDAKIGWRKYAFNHAQEVLKNWKPDVVYASALPLTSIIVGSQIAKKYNIPFVAEFRDLWVYSHDYAYQSWRKKIDQLIEKKYLDNAQKIVTVSEALADTLKKAYQKDVRIVHNGYDPDDFRNHEVKKTKKLRLVYTGTLYYPFQNPKILFDALSQMNAEEIEVVFYTDESSKSYLVDEVQSYKLDQFVQIHDKVSHREAIQAQLSSDILIHFLWDDPTQSGIYSAKLLEYIGAERLVFAFGSTRNDIAEFIEDSGLGMYFSDSKNIVQALKSAIEKKKSNGSFVRPSSEELKVKFSRKTQAEHMISIFKELKK